VEIAVGQLEPGPVGAPQRRLLGADRLPQARRQLWRRTMIVDRAWASIADRISDRQVLALEQSAIRIPSTTFEEGTLADHFANYMSDAGLEVEMMEVSHPAKPGKRTRQPVAR